MKKAWTWKNVELPSDLSAKLQHEFEVGFFKKALEHDAENVDLLVFLGDAFSKKGLTQDGLEIDKRLVKICPEEPTFHYNLACSYSLLDQKEQAFASLERAIQLGYQNFEHLLKDADLDNLRKDSRFASIMKNLQPGDRKSVV